ncbi:hypothetical protein [Kribbella antiqua]|uniref:hypothetical protein n=1 Tax=Kribbella antiqua TaxID=2512217 RepID=UPI001042FDFE|nr:hypothetical protein [Kribbella antiqua]
MDDPALASKDAPDRTVPVTRTETNEPAAQPAVLDLQRSAGNQAAASLFDGVAGQVKNASIDYGFPVGEAELAPGISVKPKTDVQG